MLDSFTLPPDFLREVADTLWGRAPRAWRAPFAAPFATEADVFRALLTLTDRLDGGETTIHPRVFRGIEPAGFHLGVHAARAEDGDLAGFQARLADTGAEVGMVVAEAMALDPVLWRRARRFQHALHAEVGMPAGGAHAEIFMGNYVRSFFGVHKDRLETFTFIVRGRKRFLVWPFEALAELGGLPPDAPLHASRIDDMDVDAWREHAVVLEGGPGDVLFWPASYWHVAEDVEGGFVTTLTLAFGPSAMLAAGSPFRLAEAGAKAAGDDAYATDDAAAPAVVGPDDVPGALAAAEERLRSWMADPVLAQSHRDAVLVWLSTGGFKVGPEQLPVPELAPEDWIASDAACPILWDEPHEDGFPCAANGIVLTTTPAFVPLCRALNAGGRFRVGDLMAGFSDGEGAPSAEDVRAALCQLASAHAVWVTATDP